MDKDTLMKQEFTASLVNIIVFFRRGAITIYAEPTVLHSPSTMPLPETTCVISNVYVTKW